MNKVHSKGVLHRDIKPENILVLTANDSLCLRLLDFGCGCLLRNEHYTEFYGMFEYYPEFHIDTKLYHIGLYEPWIC